MRQQKVQNDQLSVSGSEGLVQSLRQEADVRPDKVAEARDKIADPSYPSEAMLSRIAGLLARNISQT